MLSSIDYPVIASIARRIEIIPNSSGIMSMRLGLKATTSLAALHSRLKPLVPDSPTMTMTFQSSPKRQILTDHQNGHQCDMEFSVVIGGGGFRLR
ncbi:hypothetical protein BDW75DRAFT_198093 [Aspergillus navahoensis]